MDAPQNDPRIYFAAERTFLAWIRTGLGLMGIGFAVSRFGLFLRQMRAGSTNLPVHVTGVSVWSGAALVLLGVLVNLSAVVQHVRLIEQLRSGTWLPGLSKDALLLALVLAAVGMGMALYLVLVH